MTLRAAPPSRSFEETYLALYELAYRTSYRLSGSADLAADVAQGSLVRVYEKWRRVHSYAEPWTVRVSSNMTFDELRHQSRRSPFEFRHGDRCEDQPNVSVRN